MKRFLLGLAVLSALVGAFDVAAAAKRYQVRINGGDPITIDVEEVLPPTPQPDPGPPDEPEPIPQKPPENSPGLAVKVRDGQLYEVATGRPIRPASVNIAGDALLQPDAKLDEMFARIEKAVGTPSIVRLHHVAIDDSILNKRLIAEGKPAPPGDGDYLYQPSYREARAGFELIDRCVAQCRKRPGMYLWLTIHHRQRLTLDEAKAIGVDSITHGPRDGGIWPGEISTLFLVMPQLEKVVTDYGRDLVERFGNEPKVAIITVANEKVRYKGYTPLLDRAKSDASWKLYRDAWFQRFDEYRALTGLTDRDTHDADKSRFAAWNACSVYRRMIAAFRAAGMKQLVATDNGLGDCRMDVLPILAHPDAQLVDWHAYGFLEGQPDPFVPNDVRDLASIANAIRIAGYPLTMSEHADLHEREKRFFPGFVTGPRAVVAAGFDLGCHYAAWQGPIGFGGVGPFSAGDAGKRLFNAFDLEGFEKELAIANTAPPAAGVDGQPHEFTDEELFGAWKKVDGVWKDVPPPIVGTKRYGATSHRLRAEWWMPPKTTLAP
ncbi:MAG: hypothetical protein AB7G12_12695 [Thermoanaerobaculia bacterium]